MSLLLTAGDSVAQKCRIGHDGIQLPVVQVNHQRIQIRTGLMQDAVFAEEFGLAGSFILIGLFVALLWRVFRLAMHASKTDRCFEAYLAIGIGTWLGLQAFINLGVNMGILPTKGLTLPLISYGRSSLIVTMMALGLLLRIHHELVVDASQPNRRRQRKPSATGSRRK